jgi:hypothetical protein
MERAFKHADPEWVARVWELVEGKVSEDFETWSTNEIWEELDRSGEETHEHRALGPVITAIASTGLIQRVLDYDPTPMVVPSQRKGQHGRPISVWEHAEMARNSAKDKGDRGEREVQELLRDLLKRPTIRRALGAGRLDDVGDIDGVPNTVVQVAWWKDVLAAINTKTVSVEAQRRNARRLFAVSFIRMRKGWIVVQTPEQWERLHRYAQIGVAAEKKRRALEREAGGTKISTHGTRKRPPSSG